MKKAVIYARYSSEKQTEQSIEGQISVCKDYAKKNNIKILNTYIDRAKTGTNDNREQFQQMLKDSKFGLWDTVLVYKLDRFSRNKYEMIVHRKELRDKGVSITSAMESIPEGPEGILLESLLEGLNQYYSEELAQKTTRGLKETLKKGNFLGKTPPFGYDNVNRKLVVNKEESKIIKQIFNGYKNGKSATEIKIYLNKNNILYRKKTFENYMIYRVLRRKYYTGKSNILSENYNNIYPQIISENLFNEVQNKLKKNCKTKSPIPVENYLKNKIFCGECGNVYVLVNAGRGTRYYKCKNNLRKKLCRAYNVRKDLIEKYIIKILSKIFNAKNIEKNINKICEKLKNKSKNNDFEIKNNIKNYFLFNLELNDNLLINNLIKKIILYEDKIKIILKCENFFDNKVKECYITSFYEQLIYKKNIGRHRFINKTINKKIFVYI